MAFPREIRGRAAEKWDETVAQSCDPRNLNIGLLPLNYGEPREDSLIPSENLRFRAKGKFGLELAWVRISEYEFGKYCGGDLEGKLRRTLVTRLRTFAISRSKCDSAGDSNGPCDGLRRCFGHCCLLRAGAENVLQFH